MSGAGAAVLAWALLAGALLPPPPVRPQPLPHGDREVHEKEAQFNTTYSDWVHANLLNIYAFNHSVRRNRTEGVRVSVHVLSDQKDQPVLFVVRQKEAVVSFQVPLILRGLYQRKYAYQEVSRTLCQPQTKAEVETQHFYVDVSTLSLNTSYQLRVTRVENFVLRTNERFSFNATAAQPQYFKYEFPEEVDSVIVKVTSAMAFPCSVISIQDILCPVYDLDNNVAFIGMYQTMTKKAAITVQKKDFPSHSFYVVVVVKTEDEACGGALPYYPLSKNASPDEPVDQHNRQKRLEVMVSPAITSEAYVRSVLFCLGIFLSFYILTLLIACWESCRQHKRKGLLAAMDSPSLDTGHSRTIPDSFLNHGPYDSYGYGSFGNGSSSSTEGITDSLGSAEVSYSYVGERSLENVASRPRLDSLSSVEEDDYDTLADIDYDKNVIRTKVRVPPSPSVPLLARQAPDPPLLPAIPVRGRPGAQGQAGAAEEVPDLFLEHRHHRCLLRPARHPARHHLPDGGECHWQPGHLLLQLPVRPPAGEPQRLQQHPQQPGLRAAGSALPADHPAARDQLQPRAAAQRHPRPGVRHPQALRALLRHGHRAHDGGAAQRLLPRLPQLHQLPVRHLLHVHDCGALHAEALPEASPGHQRQRLQRLRLPGPRHLLLRGGRGLWEGEHGLLDRLLRHPHRGHAAAEHPAVLHGALEAGLGHPAQDPARAVHGLRAAVQRAHDRMVLLVMGNIINWSLAAYGLIVRPNDFASYLLAIGICNLLLYFAFYIIMKLRSGERIKLIPLLCIISTSVVWGFALFFFFQGLSTWQKTPAESREHNRDCILLDFFDDHDIWHFLSSIAMFGSFLVLLTLDDDLDCVQRDKIYVF
uniref:SID1 transmembrane family member 2 isoform X2 n=1 Tax=Agelaius phoeniceus TaxID=39638 RepID=UPI0023EC81FF|nr:SID1 transmembrane family member 2 isoform X2 [Agelaius phoeniceus]